MFSSLGKVEKVERVFLCCMVYYMSIIIIVCLVILLKLFVVGDKDRYSLPEEVKTVHAEFTYYYYPGDIPFPCK